MPSIKSGQQWLRETADMIVKASILAKETNDPLHSLHLSLIQLGFLYVDLREAIRWENGAQIVRHWKYWLPRFIGTGMKNYATESVRLLANLNADYPRHIAYIITHNRTVNTAGKPEPLDQMIEHYNL